MSSDLALELGENLAREWDEDPYCEKLRDALELVISDPPSALDELTRLAEQGSAVSMMYLGYAYWRGDFGAQINHEAAEFWLTRSANAGSIEGTFGLASYFLNNGRIEDSINRYRSLAKINYSPAQFILGRMYCKGENVRRDLNEALLFLRMAEQNGHLHAVNQIAHIMMRLEMGPVSWVRGFYKKAALFLQFMRTSRNNPNSDKLRFR